MRISMCIRFQLFAKENGNLTMLTKEKTDGLSIGGYYFVIDGKEIPFDWDAFSGDEIEGIFEFETGYGLFNDFELSECYDSDYKQLGISRDDLTAEFLASPEQIKEVHMNFIDASGEECDFGWNEDSEDFKIKLLEVSFSDLDNLEKYTVNQEVLDKFNEGVN